MDDAALRSWVSDQLFALLGFAESALVGFVIALGAPPEPLPLSHCSAACSRRVRGLRRRLAPRVAPAAQQQGAGGR